MDAQEVVYPRGSWSVMQVLLAAWMLQPYVDDDAVDATLAALTDEMKGF